MANSSDHLVWELVKKSNAFIRKNLNGVTFSAERGNLTNAHSFKASGLANLASTVDVAEVDGVVAVSKSSAKRPTRLAQSLVKKNARRANHAAAAEARRAGRADLAAAARARASAISKALRHRAANAPPPLE